MKKTIKNLVLEYFKNHPNQALKHAPVVDWVNKKWLEDHDEPTRDPWRMIRTLHQQGILIKIDKGVYKYDPNRIENKKLYDFDKKIKEAILKRDNYKCVVCGRGIEDGVELVVDHIKPKDKGGTNTIENGQTLCTEHNLLKKNYSQTEAGKRYFIKLYEKALKNKDNKMIEFCKCVFNCYDKHKINGHVPNPVDKKG